MKLSVSIPDDLWLAVRRDDEANSQTIQEALRLLADRRRLGGDMLPGATGTAYEGEQDVVAAVLERLVSEAQDLRTRGYSAGFELAQRLRWAALERLPTDRASLARSLEHSFLVADQGFAASDLEV